MRSSGRSPSRSAARSGRIYDDVGGATGIERFDDRLLNFWFEFLEGFGGYVFIERLENCLALVGSQIFHDVGDVGGMQLGQAFVRDFQLHAARWIGLDEIDEVPGNGTRRNPAQQGVESGSRGHSTQQAPDGAARAYIDRDDAQDGTRGFVGRSRFRRIEHQVDVVDADYLAPVDVDDLLIEQIAFQQEQTFGAVRGGPVSRVGRAPHSAIDAGYGCEREHAIPRLGFHDERRDAGAILLRGQGDLAHTSAGRARRVIHRGA